MTTADDELAAFIGHREHHKKWERSDPTPTPTLAQSLPMPLGGELLHFPWSVVGRNDECAKNSDSGSVECRVWVTN